MESKSNLNYSAADIIIYLLSNKIPIVFVTICGLLASLVISFLITPKFESRSIIFPASSTTVSREFISKYNFSGRNLYGIGDEEQAEQLIELVRSSEIKAIIAKKYKLLSHYEINEKSDYPMTKMFMKLNENISIRKTEFNAIDILVMDKDPILAANIANDIVFYSDSMMSAFQKKRANDIIVMINKILKEYSLNTDSSDSTNGRKNKFNSSDFLSDKEFSSEKDWIFFLKSKLVEAKIDANTHLANIIVLDKASPAEKKSYPVKWLIVSVTTILSFFISIVLVLFIDYFKKIKDIIKQQNKV